MTEDELVEKVAGRDTMLKWIEETGDNCVVVAGACAFVKLVNLELSWVTLAGLAAIGVVMSLGAFCVRRKRAVPKGGIQG